MLEDASQVYTRTNVLASAHDAFVRDSHRESCSNILSGFEAAGFDVRTDCRDEVYWIAAQLSHRTHRLSDNVLLGASPT